MSTVLSQRDRCTRRRLKAYSVLKSHLGITEEIIENFPFLIVEFKSVISVCNRIFDMLNILKLFYYSRTPVTRTLKGNEKLFELAGSIKIFNFAG